MTKDEIKQHAAKWAAKVEALTPEEREELDRKRTQEIFTKWHDTFAALAEYERRERYG